jgi:hypothetical protein
MVTQVDQLIMAAIDALDGPEEAQMVRRLLDLRDALSGRVDDPDRSGSIAEMQRHAMTSVNAYFERVLTGVHSIRAYLDGVAATYGAPRSVTQTADDIAGASA